MALGAGAPPWEATMLLRQLFFPSFLHRMAPKRERKRAHAAEAFRATFAMLVDASLDVLRFLPGPLGF